MSSDYEGVKPFLKGVSAGNDPSIGSFFLTHFISNVSLGVKIIADETTFFLCMLGLHPTPTNTFEMSNS